MGLLVAGAIAHDPEVRDGRQVEAVSRQQIGLAACALARLGAARQDDADVRRQPAAAGRTRPLPAGAVTALTDHPAAHLDRFEAPLLEHQPAVRALEALDVRPGLRRRAVLARLPRRCHRLLPVVKTTLRMPMRTPARSPNSDAQSGAPSGGPDPWRRTSSPAAAGEGTNTTSRIRDSRQPLAFMPSPCRYTRGGLRPAD